LPGTKYFILALLLSLLSTALFSQEIREESSLNYTYIGPVISVSSGSAEYSDWVEDRRVTEKTSGMSYAGGADLKILAGNFCGDFQFRYSYSQYDSTLTCLEYLIAGEYLYSINNYIAAGGGLGFYLETPPSNEEHDGCAGLYIPLTAIFTTSDGTRLFTDLFIKYGSYGIGDDTSFLSYGCNIGFVFKVGRI